MIVQSNKVPRVSVPGSVTRTDEAFNRAGLIERLQKTAQVNEDLQKQAAFQQEVNSMARSLLIMGGVNPGTDFDLTQIKEAAISHLRQHGYTVEESDV